MQNGQRAWRTKKNRALSQCCHWWRRPPLGKRRWVREKALWVLGLDFPSTYRRPETSPVRRYLTICSEGSWRHPLDHWLDRVWRAHCHEERFCTWRRWNSMCRLQMCGRTGLQFLFNAYKCLLEGGTVPEHFAKSRTVFIPKTSDIDDNGRIIRSPDALRPLTLCNCDCILLTSAICRGLHWYSMRCIHPSQGTWQTTSLRSRPRLWLMLRALRRNQAFYWRTLQLPIPVSIMPGSFQWSRRLNCLILSPASCEIFITTAPRTWNSREQDNSL